MKMIKPLVGMLVVACAMMFLAGQTAKAAAAAKSAGKDALYVCGCGPDCKCTSVSTKPGKCSCGQALKQGHLCKVEKDVALLCVCDPGCKCALDPKDETKCGCGKALRKVSLKGTGIYFCNCGSSCTCNTVSAKPGKCKCGMALKKT